MTVIEEQPRTSKVQIIPFPFFLSLAIIKRLNVFQDVLRKLVLGRDRLVSLIVKNCFITYQNAHKDKEGLCLEELC